MSKTEIESFLWILMGMNSLSNMKLDWSEGMIFQNSIDFFDHVNKAFSSNFL